MSYTDIEDRVPGFLTQIEITDKDRENLLDYMKNVYPGSYVDFIYSLLGDKFLMFYDVLEGVNVRVPSRSSIARVVNHVKIYTYLQNRGYTDEAVTNASLVFKKRVQVIRDIYEGVDKMIKGEVSIDPDAEDVSIQVENEDEEVE